jgi:hypothetical protein
MRNLGHDKRTRSLYEEVTQGMRRIIERTSRATVNRKAAYINAVGAELYVDTRTEHGAICSHILTGYEQWVIREMCRGNAGLRAVIYDGYISEPVDVASLERRVRQRSKEQLGIELDMKLSRKDFSVPFESPRRQATEF